MHTQIKSRLLLPALKVKRLISEVGLSIMCLHCFVLRFSATSTQHTGVMCLVLRWSVYKLIIMDSQGNSILYRRHMRGAGTRYMTVNCICCSDSQSIQKWSTSVMIVSKEIRIHVVSVKSLYTSGLMP